MLSGATARFGRAENRRRSASARDGPQRHWHPEDHRQGHLLLQKTFGFETAVSEARRAIYAANTEAEAAPNGLGLVKLIGRDSGFIAAYSVLVDGQANFCLAPEVPFTLENFLAGSKLRLERRGHAVIVVAEGAGQDLLKKRRAATLLEAFSTETSELFCATRSRTTLSRPARN